MNKKIHFIKFETKNIDTSLFYIVKILSYLYFKIWAVIKRFYIFIISILLCLFFYNSMSNMFSNKYILTYFLPNKLYTSKCLKLSDKPSLPAELALFFNKNNKINTTLPIIFNSFPSNIGTLSSGAKRDVFAHIMLPILMKIEVEIVEDRKYILSISNKMLEKPLGEQDFVNIRILAEKYDVQMSEYNFWDYVVVIEELVKRINIVPSSVLIGVLAYDTSWGEDQYFILNSKFAFILQYFYSNKKNGENQNMIFDKTFFNLGDALAYYYHKINTDKTYHNFRITRYLSNLQDVNHLVRLANSLIATDYKESINLLSIIRDNKLLMYDNILYGDSVNNSCIEIG